MYILKNFSIITLMVVTKVLSGVIRSSDNAINCTSQGGACMDPIKCDGAIINGLCSGNVTIPGIDVAAAKTILLTDFKKGEDGSGANSNLIKRMSKGSSLQTIVNRLLKEPTEAVRERYCNNDFLYDKDETQGLKKEKSDDQLINIKDISFMQNSCDSITKDNTFIMKISDPTIRIWKDKKGRIWTLDHRRLAGAIINEQKQIKYNIASKKEWDAECSKKMDYGGNYMLIRNLKVINKNGKNEYKQKNGEYALIEKSSNGIKIKGVTDQVQNAKKNK